MRGVVAALKANPCAHAGIPHATAVLNEMGAVAHLPLDERPACDCAVAALLEVA